MFFLVLILTVLVVVLFSQVRGLRTRLEALELKARQASPAPLDFQTAQPQAAQIQAAQPVQNSPASVPLNSTTASAPSPWPAGQAPKLGPQTRPGEGWNVPGGAIPVAPGTAPVGPVAASGFPGTSFSAPISGNPANGGHGIRPPVQREPINVQRWLTRAGIVATLLGAAYVLAVLEAQGLIGPWWRVLAGLLLGGWLSGLAVRAASSVRAAGDAQPQTESASPSPSGSLWVAEALGSLGIGVTLLTLTFAARSGGGSGPWAAALTLMAFAGALLARRWGGLATPLVALSALSVALLLAQNRPGDHLWNLSLPGLVCMVWTLAVLALLPLLIRERGWRVALPGAVALALLSVFAALTEIDALSAGQSREQAGVALLVGTFALLGVLLRPALKIAPESAESEVALEGLERTLRSLVGAVALGTATGAFCRLTGMDLRWAVPLAAALMVALLSTLPSRLADAGVLRRVTFSAALLAGVTAVGEGLALHSGDASGRIDWLLGLACLGVTVLAAWRLDGWQQGGGKQDGWRLYGLRVPRFLLVLALCVPLGLAFGVSGVALPLVAWLARWQTGAKGTTGIPGTSELPGTPPLSWRSVRTWHAEPPAVWAVVALPLLASGELAGTPPAHLSETFLLLLGAAALAGYSLEGLLRAPAGRLAWTLSGLLAWTGSWLLAALLGRVQGTGTENFLPTTPFLALLGGWLLFRAQPSWPGSSRWKWSLWMSGAGLLVFALLRVLLSDLSDTGALVRAGGLLGAGLVTVLAAVRFPPPSRQEPNRQEPSRPESGRPEPSHQAPAPQDGSRGKAESD
ncbi:hypothetical protein [Deinococcus altitudinis]|uniref:hypothetical protein n=1 Tax=Deinococcus altitudinis TaxID=468914 RepID=UPI003891DB4D